MTWESLAGLHHDDFELSASGALTFKSPPNHEDQSEYQVTLSVSDGDLTGTLDVVVTVTNVNEAPLVGVTFGNAMDIVVSGEASRDYAENLTDPVALVLASDPERITPTLSLANKDDVDDFELIGGYLTFSRTPDYEDPTDSGRNNEYKVTVQADDGNSYGTRDVVVTVTDVDEAPAVSGDTAVGFAENGDGRVARYRATDPEGATIEWSLAAAGDWGGFRVVCWWCVDFC